MEVVPASVGEASRRWDDQHLALRSASDGIASAPTGGFTAAVAGGAGRFTAAWSRMTDDLGAECEQRADSLRSTIQDFLATDAAAFEHFVALGEFVRERR